MLIAFISGLADAVTSCDLQMENEDVMPQPRSCVHNLPIVCLRSKVAHHIYIQCISRLRFFQAQAKVRQLFPH